jgi:hypothetical protein
MLCTPITYTGCNYSEGVYYDNTSLFQVTSLSSLVIGDFYFDYGNDTIYIADDPTGHTIEASTAAGAIWGNGGSTGQTNVTVQGLTVEKFANVLSDPSKNAAIKAGWDWTIRDNVIRLNSGMGVVANNGSLVTNNDLRSNGQYGISFGPADDVTVSYNEISFNNSANFDFGWGGATRSLQSSNVMFLGNYVHDNNGHGLWSDGDNINVTYDSNTVENNVGVGIFHEISYDATIKNNIVRWNDIMVVHHSICWGANIYLNDSQNVEIYGNTVEATDGTNGIGLYDIERGTGKYGPYQLANDYIHDNVIKMHTASLVTGEGVSGLAGRTASYTTANNRFVNNTYYVTSLSGYSWEYGPQMTKPLFQGAGQDLNGKFYTW